MDVSGEVAELLADRFGGGTVPVVRLELLEVGPIAAAGVMPSVMPSGVVDASGEIDGILGQDVLAPLRYTIDFAARRRYEAARAGVKVTQEDQRRLENEVAAAVALAPYLSEAGKKVAGKAAETAAEQVQAKILEIAGKEMEIDPADLGQVERGLARLGLGRLPGDVVFKRGHVTFYFPIVTSLVASLVLTVILWLIGR